MSGLDVIKTQYKERLPFDRNLYQAFVYTKVSHGPVLSLEKFAVESADGDNVYNIPALWIDMGRASKKQINLIPLLAILGGAGLRDGEPSNAGLIFLNIISNFRWMPAFFTVEYTAGISNKEGQVPVIINDIIGMTAAINILGAKQTQNKYSSTAISRDGIAESVSSQGTQVYQPRIQQLMDRRDMLLKKIKAKTTNKYFLTNV
jgi:hypothetical protein